MIRRLLSALRLHNRQPQEPPRTADHAHADPAAPGVHLRGVLDAGAGNGAAGVVQHEGAQDDAATSAFFAGLRADDTASLDPVEMAWEQACRDAQAAVDAEAEAGRVRLYAALEELQPGWNDAICERHGCGLCAHDFSEAMEVAGVIALPAVAVDYSTGEYRMVPA
jgi:hypothetical protein